MQHLDEGTIHAWLDGELPFDESSRVTAHAETCAQCSALIAEARGFIAASTRILRNLDDVPAGVIPATAPGTTDGHTGFTPRDWGIVLPIPRRAVPKHWIPSRFAAAAAFAIMAVGVYTVMNRSDRSAMSEISVPITTDGAPARSAELMDSGALSSEVLRDVKDAAAQSSTTAKATPAPSAPAQKANAPQPSRALSARAGQDAMKRTDVIVTGAGANRERTQEAAARTPPPAAATLPPPDLAVARARQLTKVAPAPAPAAATMDSGVANKTLARAAQPESARSVAREESLQAARVAEPKRLAVPADSAIESERRRLVGESQVQSRIPPITTTGTALSDDRQRLATKLTVTTAVGCYDLRRGDAANEAGAPSWVRLANVPVRVGSRTLRLALPGGEPQGEQADRWYWSLGSGAIVLHKVVGGVVRFEGRVAAVRRAC